VGLNIPVEILGAAAMMTTLSKNQKFVDRYSSESIGGLISAGLVEPAGSFGQFCLVILALGAVGNNIPNMCSMALTRQALHPRLQWFLLSSVSIISKKVGYNGHAVP